MKCSYQIADSELHCFAFEPIDSRMYLLLSGSEALVVDPCVDVRALQSLRANGIKSAIILPTHEHYDHISGANWLKAHFPCRIVASESAATCMASPKLNASMHFEALFTLADEETRRKVSELNIRPYSCTADEVFTGCRRFSWQGHTVEIRETPGHSRGSVCIIIDGNYVFTGDSLIKGRPTITRLPGGSRKEFVEVTLPFLKSLLPTSVVFPGHGEPGYVRDFIPMAGW